ncbi:MAG TPA: LysE family transporter [Abditibacteriaceae bacterium]|jgi:RhtB (resistance to homoserine/threonine) family protein
MQYAPEFFTLALLHLLAVMSPGPDFALISRNSLLYSRRTGVYSALGIALGILVHVTYSLVGIGLVIARSPLLFALIQYSGAAYLLYLGVKSFASAGVDETLGTATSYDLSAAEAVRSGFFTNALNPKASLFFLSVFSQVVKPSTPTALKILYGLEMSFITFWWFATVALVLSHSSLRKRFAQAQPLLAKVMGVVLILLGLRVAFAHVS